MNYKVIVFDTETGGLDSAYDSILSIGMVLLDNGEVKDTYYSLIREEEIHAGQEALNVNGLTLDEIVANGKSDILVRGEIEGFVKKHFGTEKAILVGHNVSFDLGFLKRMFPPPAFRRLFLHRSLDTQAAAQILMYADRIPQLKSTSLDELCKHFGIKIRDEAAHNALQDATATAKLLTEMIKLTRKVPEF